MGFPSEGEQRVSESRALTHLQADAFGVEVERLTKQFGEVIALDEVNLTIPSGSFFSLLGPSGCGKSTLLRIISGFDRSTQGAVRIGGRDMSSVPPNRRPTALVFQRWALFPHMTVRKNIAFGLQARKLSAREVRARVDELVALVDLGGMEDRRPAQLSGGQQQRVALARALAIKPGVLLLDEPLASLDLRLRVQMQIELKRIQREVGTTFVFVTHDQGEAMSMSDGIAVMNRGRVEQLGTPQEIYDHPVSAFVASFIGDTNLIRVAPGSGRRELIVGGRTIPAPSTGDVAAAGSVSVRFERMLVGSELPCAVRFAGRIEDVSFTGRSVRYRVVAPELGAPVTAEIPRLVQTALHAVGDSVEVGWDADSAVVLAA